MIRQILYKTIINRLLVSLAAHRLPLASTAAAVAVLILAGVCYGEYKDNAAVATGNARPGPQPEVLAGNAVETEEKVDEAVAETISKAIGQCSCDALQSARPGSRNAKVSLTGSITFTPGGELPLRMKIYRSAAIDGQYSLILNNVLKNFNRPADSMPSLQQQLESMKKGVEQMQQTLKQGSPGPGLQQAIVTMENRIKTLESAGKKNGGKININPEMLKASLIFNITDAAPLDCGSNNVFYKIRLCSESGVPVIESRPMKVPLTPRVVVADDLKTWAWTPFFPGKDQLDGVLQNGKTAIPVSNAPVKGQFADTIAKDRQSSPLMYFKPSKNLQSSWRYSRSGENQPNSLLLDATEIRPVFDGGLFFQARGPVELKSLKIDGRKVGMQADKANALIVKNNITHTTISTLPGQIVPLNYPGTPVAELEFAYEGSTNTLCVQLPPVPTGLRAELLENGSVKLTWDALADRIDRKQIPAPPDIKLLRDNKVIHTCDIKQTEFIDKQTEPGRIHQYSMALDNASAKVQVWTKEKGLTESKIIVKDLENPYPENYKAVVFIYPEKPPARPVRVSFWEPALCYDSTGVNGMRLFSAAVQKLAQEADFEVLDRISRNNVIEEKVLTMSYEKSILIKTLPADFTILVRDYSRQEGNGAELWLIQNKAFDYKEIKNSKGGASTHVDNDFLAWRIGSISTDELKVPERVNDLGDKLVAEIRRKAFFKNAVLQKDTSVPLKFVFNPLQTVRQSNMVNGSRAIGESIMIELSSLMSGCNIMTRDNWKTIFEEQSLMREQGESLDNDISGSVSISGYVWQEKDRKQYVFILTAIKSGICIGTLQCSGTIENVTAQLAAVCKKIKLPVFGGNESGAQTKAEFEQERWKIYDCFMHRFGVRTSSELYESLTGRHEMSKPEFAEEQWRLGNREKAVALMENLWNSDKSVWKQLSNYHCMTGNYARALQIVETMMQQNDASNDYMPEYYRLRAMVAKNAKPEIIENLERGQKEEPENNKHDNNNYFERAPDSGLEWSLDDFNQFMTKAYFAIARNPDAKLDDIIKSSSNPFHFTSGTFWVERQKSKEEMACSTGRQLMEVKLKKVINKMQNQHRKIGLIDMVCIDITAQLGNPAAQNLLNEINSLELPPSLEELRKLNDGNVEHNYLKPGDVASFMLKRLQDCYFEPFALLAFKVYKGDRRACELALKHLRNGGSLGGAVDPKEVFYLMSMSGREELVTAMLAAPGHDADNNIAAIRWGDRRMLKSLLIEHPELFKTEVFFSLIDGINDPDFRDVLFNRKSLFVTDREPWIKSVLWLGRPLPDLYRDLTLNYKRGK